MHLNSNLNIHASMSASFGAAPGGTTAQMQAMLRAMMTMLNHQLGVGRGRGGCFPAPPRPNFGAFGPNNCGGGPFQRPGLSNFCGGGRGGNNVNINLNGCPQNVNINLNGFPQRRGCQGGMHGQLHGQMGCRGREGQLQQKGKGKPVEYTTRGGYRVTVNKDKVKVLDPNGNEVKQQGDPHEHLNGKHVKDWKGKQRSLILGDGTKITMSADGPKGVTKHTSIYDGRQNVQINNAKNQIEHHSMNGLDTMFRELFQYDGETAGFTSNCQGDGLYYNMYNEGSDFSMTRDFQWLGRVHNGRVQDFYDDPRLGKT